MEASLLGYTKQAQVLYEKIDILNIFFTSFSFSFCYIGYGGQALVEEIIWASTLYVFVPI